MTLDFDEYKIQDEPGKREKSEIWSAAIGLQQVDGLKTSEYLIKTAIANIEGDITFDEVKNRLNAYYKENPARTAEDEKTEEADKVSARIAEILSEKTFHFSPAEYIEIHRRLFEGIYKFAGKVRDYNITKEEWVLGGETVLYSSANTIMAALKHDFDNEKSFNYRALSKQQIMERISKFTSDIWQIHPFGEGNTRTTAVFIIKYLRKLGFNVDNEQFAKHSWYFRNALVRANYTDFNKEVASTSKFLHLFLGNLLLGEKNELKNRHIHIEWQQENGTVNSKSGTVKQENGTVNQKDDKVFDVIKRDGSLKAEEIAKELGIGLRTVKRHIKKLKESGEIERTGSDKVGYWKVRRL